MRASTIAFVAPFLTVLQSHYFLDEKLGWIQLFGGVLVVGGSALVVQRAAPNRSMNDDD